MPSPASPATKSTAATTIRSHIGFINGTSFHIGTHADIRRIALDLVESARYRARYGLAPATIRIVLNNRAQTLVDQYVVGPARAD